MPASFRVVILGGYGNFGQIIARHLVAIEGIQVIIAGRHFEKAQKMAQILNCEAAVLDSGDPTLAQHLRQLAADCLIFTVGPFQTQGYQVAQAAIEAGVHYIDLADARAFVCGITTLNDQAVNKDVLVCSGASSVPGLSSAVIDHLLPQFSTLQSIDFAISSSARMPGEITLRSVLTYCGKPFQQWKNNTWQTVYGWQDLHTHHFQQIAGKRLLANCDIPDLSLLKTRYADVHSVRFSAGVGLKLGQLGAWALSWLVRTRLIQHPEKFAALLHKSGQSLSFMGNGLSAMYIQLTGLNHDRQTVNWGWEITAQHDNGHHIPCLAAVALIRKLHSGQLQQRGAMPCLGLLTLREYLNELESLNIETMIYQIDEQGHWQPQENKTLPM